VGVSTAKNDASSGLRRVWDMRVRTDLLLRDEATRENRCVKGRSG
jgi:hypothetical protein